MKFFEFIVFFGLCYLFFFSSRLTCMCGDVWALWVCVLLCVPLCLAVFSHFLFFPKPGHVIMYLCPVLPIGETHTKFYLCNSMR